MSHVATVSGVWNANRTLRNTFLLLCVTMLPTVFGAWAGVRLGLPELFAAAPVVSLLMLTAISFVLITVIHATAESSAGLGVLAMNVFALFMGATISGGVESVLSEANGFNVVAAAALGTGALLVGCSAYAMTTSRDFSAWGGFLFGALLALVAVCLMNAFVLQLSWLEQVLSGATLLLFSAYLVYDVQSVVHGGERNYVIAALSVYLDLLNIFMSLLNLLDGDD